MKVKSVIIGIAILMSVITLRAQTPPTNGPIIFVDSKWTVLDAFIMGDVLKPHSDFDDEAKTEGKFIQVKYKVTNTPKQEERIIEAPILIDSEGREFKEYDEQSSYIPEKGKTISFEALPASMSRTYYAIYEVPADSTGIVFRVRSLAALTTDYKRVPLGLESSDNREKTETYKRMLSQKNLEKEKEELKSDNSSPDEEATRQFLKALLESSSQ